MQAPSNEALKRFAIGQSDPAEAESIAEWLATQPDAASTIEALAGDDTLLQNLKNVATIDTSVSNDVQTLIDKLRQAVIAQAAQADAMELLALKRLNEFRVVRVIGAGGMGLVCEAFDERLNRKVAIKLMRNELMVTAANKKRFLREAQVAASIEHEAIVPILSAGEANGVSYLVMPLLQGETLADRLRRGPLSCSMLLQLATEISEGLAAAHAAGIVHRDLKPSNIWLSKRANDRQVRARLLDFGLARDVETDDRLTQSNQMIGTPAYMAPEQAQGQPGDMRTDIYSLGCVLYETATGRRPFEGKNLLEMLTKVVSTKPSPISHFRDDLVPAFSELVESMLSSDAGQRPQSAQEVLGMLAIIRDGQSVGAAKHEPPGAMASQLPARLVPLRTIAVAAGVAGILAAAMLGVLITIKRPDGTETTIESKDATNITVFASGDVEVRVDTKPLAKTDETSMQPDRPTAETAPQSENDAKELTAIAKLKEIGAVVSIRLPSGAIASPEQFVPGSTVFEIQAEANPQFSDDLFHRYIAPLERIEVMFIPFAPKLLDASRFFEAISKFKSLRTVSTTLPLDDECCEQLAHCSQLSHLQWAQAAFTEAGATHLLRLESLAHCRFSKGNSVDKDVAPLLKLPSLESFAFIGLKLTGDFLAGEPLLPNIKDFDLSGTNITDDSMRFFQRFPNVVSIALEGVSINDRGLVHLKNLKHLRVARLHGSHVRDPAGLAAIALAPSLDLLDLHVCPVNDDGVAAIASANSNTLNNLTLDGTKISDRAIPLLAQMPALQNLSAFGVNVSGEGFAELGKSNSLVGLTIGLPQLNDETIRGLATRPEKWQHIHILEGKLTDASIPDFSKMVDLMTLRIIGSQITPEGLEKLKAALPQAEISTL